MLCLVVLAQSASAPHSSIPPVGGASALRVAERRRSRLGSELCPCAVAPETATHTEPPAAAHGLAGGLVAEVVDEF